MVNDGMFSFSTAQKIVFGVGSIRQVGEEVQRIGGKKVVVITDSGIIKSGLDRKITSPLEKNGLRWDVWSDVEPEPSVECGQSAADFAKEGGFDCIVGYGGGSSMDVAKAVAVLATNKGKLIDYLGKPESITNPLGNLILCPTTAGTGSEVSNAAVFAVPEEKMKYVLYHSTLYPDVAILDPDLTKTMPPKVTAYTGVDALCHAIEGYVSVEANPLIEVFSEEAIKLISENLRDAYADGGDMKAREKMLLASYLAGLSFGNAGTVLGHAVGYAYGFELHLPHGLSIGLTMPHVLEYNASSSPKKHGMIACLLGENVEGVSIEDAAAKAACGVQKLLHDLQFPSSIGEVGVTEDMIPMLADNVFKSTKHVARNPRKVTKKGMRELFRRAVKGRLVG